MSIYCNQIRLKFFNILLYINNAYSLHLIFQIINDNDKYINRSNVENKPLMVQITCNVSVHVCQSLSLITRFTFYYLLLFTSITFRFCSVKLIQSRPITIRSFCLHTRVIEGKFPKSTSRVLEATVCFICFSCVFEHVFTSRL